MITRFIGMLVIGVLVGAGFVYTMMGGFGNNSRNTNQTQQQQPTNQPTTQPQTTIQQSQSEKEAQQQLDELRTRLFEEGITSHAIVDIVYPGIGFIIRDTEGERLFVQWQGNTPSIGQRVEITGTVTRVEERIGTLQNKPGFTEELRTFLQGQRIMIIASDVNIS